MGIYYQWVNHTKKRKLNGPLDKCPCSQDTMLRLLELAFGEWQGDIVSIASDMEDDGLYFKDWPTEELGGDDSEDLYPTSRYVPPTAWEEEPLTPERVLGWVLEAARPEAE